MKKTQIGGVEVKRTYRPARIICDVISLALVVVIVRIGIGLTVTVRFLGWKGLLIPLAFAAAAIALCAAYIRLSFRGMRFKRLEIAEHNAQSVYNWWTFSMSLVKIPLQLALFNGLYIYHGWAATGRPQVSGVPIAVDVLLSVLLALFSARRIKALCAVKKASGSDGAMRVKAKIVEEEEEK